MIVIIPGGISNPTNSEKVVKKEYYSKKESFHWKPLYEVGDEQSDSCHCSNKNDTKAAVGARYLPCARLQDQDPRQEQLNPSHYIRTVTDSN